MNLKAIAQIVNLSTVSDEYKEKLIISILSQDINVIPTILEILSQERNSSKSLIADLNLEVSRYHVYINDKSLLKRNLKFLNQETKSLYEKWKAFINPCFNNNFDNL